MARLERFELPTARFVAEYSIQLSYRRIILEGAIIGVYWLKVNENVTDLQYSSDFFRKVFSVGPSSHQIRLIRHNHKKAPKR